VLESLVNGRYVLWTYPFPGAERADTVEHAAALIDDLCRRHADGTLALNDEGRRAVIEMFEPAEVRKDIVEGLGAMAQQRWTRPPKRVQRWIALAALRSLRVILRADRAWTSACGVGRPPSVFRRRSFLEAYSQRPVDLRLGKHSLMSRQRLTAGSARRQVAARTHGPLLTAIVMGAGAINAEVSIVFDRSDEGARAVAATGDGGTTCEMVGSVAAFSGTIEYFIDRRAAAAVYGRRLHTITLLVVGRVDDLGWPAPGRSLTTSARGFNVRLWQAGGLGYALVSDVDGAELAQLAARLGG
jgi:hypothetical protein